MPAAALVESVPMGDDAAWVHYSELDPWDRNPNTHPAEQPEQIAESIRAFGFVAPCVVWRSADRLVAGHGRLLAMRKLAEGYTYLDAAGEFQERGPEPDFQASGSPGPGLVRVVYHEFESESHADAYAMADNELTRRSELDPEAAAALLREIDADAQFGALHAIGFPTDQLRALLDAPPPPGDDPDPTATPTSATAQDPATDPEDPSSRAPAIVDWTVPMAVEERSRCHAVVNLAKRVAGVTTTREAVLAIIEAYEASHGEGS